MKTILALLCCLFFTIFAGAVELEALVVDAINAEEVRERELQLSKNAVSEGDGATAAKHKQLAEGIDAKQAETLLEISRKLFSQGYFENEESAISMLVRCEKSIAETESTIALMKERGISDLTKMDLLMISLNKTLKLWRQRAIEEGLFILSLERVNRYFPAMKDENSEFAKRVQAKIDKAVDSENPICGNPRHVFLFAVQTRDEMNLERYKNEK